ncbi:glycosyltransferase [Chloroflexi bacterium TSY]|nr:glycosyltransferase [Chloroflexi bacterium TSY]
MTTVQASVIIPSYNASSTIRQCLSALERQSNRREFEIIVVDSSTDDTPTIVSQEFPTVQFHHFAERKHAGGARNFGAAQSCADLLIFIDVDCMVEENGVAQIISAHARTNHPVVGGALTNGNPHSYVGWAYYFSSFSQWMPQKDECERIDIPTGCMSVKRWAFEQYGPFLEDGLCEDTAFNWVLAAAGHTALFVLSIRVAHINVEQLSLFLRHKVKHGKTFAQIRIAKKAVPFRQLLLYLLGSPLLPFLFLYRRTQDVRKSNIYHAQYLRSLPLVFLGIICWSFGEFLGYLAATVSATSEPSD